jgi:hypothetical protein
MVKTTFALSSAIAVRPAVYLRGFSLGPCLDFLGRNRIMGSSFIGHHSLESVSVLVRDPFCGNTHKFFVTQPGANACRG